MISSSADLDLQTQTEVVFRLLDLPPELQIYIYELTVIHDQSIRINFPCEASFPSADSGLDGDSLKIGRATWLAER